MTLLQVESDGLEFLVEAQTAPGSQPTGVGDALDHAGDVLDQAGQVIAAAARSVIGHTTELAHTLAPDGIELELNVKFDTRGRVIIATVGAEATLRVKLTWNNTTTPAAPQASAAGAAEPPANNSI